MLEVKNLTKYYGRGKNKILGCKDISFILNSGEITSLLGLNGAGKSSIINCITGFLNFDKGEVLINNFSLTEDEIEAKKRIGILYEQTPLYSAMTVKEFLFFCAEMRGKVYKKNTEYFIQTTIEEKVSEVIEFCEIEDYANRLIKNLSKGYKQRVGLAQAVLTDAPLLILDEPTDGLDAVQIRRLEKKIFQIAKEKTILISTHNLKQASQICSNHILINGGEIIAQGKIFEIKNQLEEAGCEFDSEDAENVLEQAFLFFCRS